MSENKTYRNIICSLPALFASASTAFAEPETRKNNFIDDLPTHEEAPDTSLNDINDPYVTYKSKNQHCESPPVSRALNWPAQFLPSDQSVSFSPSFSSALAYSEPASDKFLSAINSPSLDTGKIEDIQREIGANDDGVFGNQTATKLIAYAQEYPENLSTIGKALTDAIAKENKLPEFIHIYAEHFRNDTNLMQRVLYSAIEHSADPFIFKRAMNMAAGNLLEAGYKEELTVPAVTQVIAQINFQKTGSVSQDAKETDPLGLCIANFEPISGTIIKDCQTTLTTLNKEEDIGADPKGVDTVAGKNTALAIARRLAHHPEILTAAAYNGKRGFTLFSFLHETADKEPEIIKVLSDNTHYQNVLTAKLVNYARLISRDFNELGETGFLYLPPIKGDSLAPMLSMAQNEEVYSYDPYYPEFNEDFAIAAQLHLLSALERETDKTKINTLEKAINIFSEAQSWEPFKSPLLQNLSEKYQNAPERVLHKIIDISEEYGINPYALAAVVAIETNRTFRADIRPVDRKTKKLLSSAVGLGQFTTSYMLRNWREHSDILEKKLGLPDKLDASAILKLRENEDVTLHILALNMEKSGVKNSLEWYLKYHHFNWNVGNKLMNARYNDSVASIIGQQAVRANPHLKRLSAGQLRDSFSIYFNHNGQRLYADTPVKELYKNRFLVTDTRSLAASAISDTDYSKSFEPFERYASLGTVVYDDYTELFNVLTLVRNTVSLSFSSDLIPGKSDALKPTTIACRMNF